MTRPLMVDVKDLCKNYGPVRALRNGSFKVTEGEIIALLGPNGAGKTTMMKIITGFLEQTSGEVFIDGLSMDKDRLEIQRRIGYLPENAPIYGDMLVQDYLAFSGSLRGMSGQVLLQAMGDAVSSTGLRDVLTRPVRELSKGFRQRVVLAQAILHRPRLLILDEPTNGLDPTQIVEIRHLIKRLAKNSTVILSTHILSEAEATCDRAIIMIQGEIKADARLADLSETTEVVLALANISDPQSVMRDLSQIEGIGQVVPMLEPASGLHDGLKRFRLSGRSKDLARHQLALKIFSHAKDRGYQVCELRPEMRTLEAVFRDLALPTAAKEIQA